MLPMGLKCPPCFTGKYTATGPQRVKLIFTEFARSMKMVPVRRTGAYLPSQKARFIACVSVRFKGSHV